MNYKYYRYKDTYSTLKAYSEITNPDYVEITEQEYNDLLEEFREYILEQLELERNSNNSSESNDNE